MKTVIVCSGGSGGHVFPAIALCEQLIDSGYSVILLTDKRGFRYCSDLKFPVKVMPKISASISTIFSSFWNILRIFIGLRVYWKENRPELVVGFGGIMTLVPLLLAKIMGIKTMIHEQNVMFGKANKFLDNFVNFTTVNFADDNPKHLFVETPVRSFITSAFATPYSFKGKTKFVISAIGGSQSADIFSSVIPNALKLLKSGDCKHIKIIHQVSEPLINDLKNFYDSLGVECDLRPFIDNIASVIGDSNLVICRAGASTLAELATIGRPAILIPYPYAGGHQRFNAEYFENLGAAWVINEKNFSAKSLALKLEGLLYNTDQLVIAAVNMLKSRKPSANKRLVEFCKKVIDEA